MRLQFVPDGGNGLVESRRAIDDEELGTLKPALDEIVEPRAPGLGALAGHALDRKLTRPSPYLALDRSNRLSKRSTAISLPGCMKPGFVVSAVWNQVSW
jgi:hypothetical protein